jgi:signal transduction histidine kinase
VLVTTVGPVALRILTGFAGQISPSDVAFLAIGAYPAAVLGTRFGMPFWLILRAVVTTVQPPLRPTIVSPLPFAFQQFPRPRTEPETKKTLVRGHADVHLRGASVPGASSIGPPHARSQRDIPTAPSSPMQSLPALVRIYESENPTTAFQGMVESLSTDLPLRCALRVSLDGNRTTDRWPADAEISADLLDTAVHVLRPEVFPLGSDLPFDAVRFPDAEALFLPVHRQKADGAVVILVAEAGAFGEESQPWDALAGALERVDERHRRVCAAEEECGALRRRVEQIEALHTLGLSANRTLDPDEVLNLVARFTRTLLGAHYVSVHTGEQGRMHTVASVGLRAGAEGRDDYLLARRVVEMEKPLLVGGAGAHFPVDEFPFQVAEGMRTGVGLPLSLFGESFGALIVGYRRECEITPRDIGLALALADHAAVAISNARLHRAVEQRSRELQLAYEQLHEATRAKERFYNAVSHDLRTPVGAIKGYSELLLEGAAGELPEQASKWIGNTHRATQSLLALVDDLLDFAKLEAGKVELQPCECTLGEIVEDTLAAVRPQADEKGLRIDVEGLDGVPRLNTDPRRLRQILINLFSNAVKFTPSGKVRLTAGLLAEEPDLLEIRVIDTGPGIPVEYIERIFDEFEQIPGSEGTGLGLSISRKLARLLGGELSAHNEPEAGASFVLRMPGTVARPVHAGTP